MLFFDATHTSHTHAQTGIQRVCRSLFAELNKTQAVTGVCHDPYLKSWRPLTETESGNMVAGLPSANSRTAKWPLRQQIISRTRHLLGRTPSLAKARALVMPELFSSKVAAHLPELFAAVSGPRVAIFYDAIPLKFPELTPPGTVARLPAYLRELLQFDGIAAISEDSAASLQSYWRWLGVPNPPPVQAIPLGVDPLNFSSTDKITTGPRPRILCVGTIEGRKNHLALLDAAELLWKEGLDFELQLTGLARLDTAARAIKKIADLKQAGRPLMYAGSVTDAEVQSAYRHCLFTVYPSLIEGFGLPVLESLQHGRPCICSAQGALAESAHGGGCLTLNSLDSQSLATAIRSLLQDSDKIAGLSAAARSRKFQSWSGYASDLVTWMESLPPRD